MSHPQSTAADGLVIVDKPSGMTSHDVVARIRRLAGTRKVGHAGTLDPMATGVLVVGIGRATKLLTYLVGATKEYSGTIRLGIGTTTDDAQGEVLAIHDVAGISTETITEAVRRWSGDIMQVPSAVSAIKVAGERAYAKVRQGETVILSPRPVTISAFIIEQVHHVSTEHGSAIDVNVHVECSSGTYIRALARDVGAELGVGGHLTALRRSRVGAFRIDQARTMTELTDQVDAAGTLEVIPLARAIRGIFPARQVDHAQARALSYGQWISASEVPGIIAVFADDGAPIALVENIHREGAPRAKPLLVWAPAS